MAHTLMHIQGACHCSNIRFELAWPETASAMPARSCGCSFCRKHGGTWTSHPAAALVAQIDDITSVAKYRFGTKTAEFFVCSTCGVVPFVVSNIDGTLYAVVNVNTFESTESLSLSETATSFDGEDTDSRLERRTRNWIANVRIAT